MGRKRRKGTGCFGPLDLADTVKLLEVKDPGGCVLEEVKKVYERLRTYNGEVKRED